jgi:tetratricopeptide (TPR) repeat protein
VLIRPGLLRDNAARTRQIEAALRLHVYLGLRDASAGPVELVWSPAGLPSEAGGGAAPPEPDAGPCVQGTDAAAAAAAFQGGVFPDPQGRDEARRKHASVLLTVASSEGPVRVEALQCARGGVERRQAFESAPDALGTLLRELLVWMASGLGVPDPGSLPDAWGRPPAPRIGPLLGLGDTLARSMQADSTGLDARVTASVPEAAWLAAEAEAPGPLRRRLLERAASLRPGFTAALEDLAWDWLFAGEPGVARATLLRLGDPEERRRPSELLLAARLLQAGQASTARDLLQLLPSRWAADPGAARLRALAALGAGRPEEARSHAEAWAAADPQSGEALVVLGDALLRLGRDEEAAGCWRRAFGLDIRFRHAALRRWAAFQVEEGRAADAADELSKVVDFKGDFIAGEIGAWLALLGGDPGAALASYLAALDAGESSGSASDEDRSRLRVGACLATLALGRELPAGDAQARCAELPGNRLERGLVDAGLAAREPGLIPGYSRDLAPWARELRELAPLDPGAATLALVQADWGWAGGDVAPLRADWRVAAGAGATVPPSPATAAPRAGEDRRPRPSPSPRRRRPGTRRPPRGRRRA